MTACLFSAAGLVLGNGYAYVAIKRFWFPFRWLR